MTRLFVSIAVSACLAACAGSESPRSTMLRETLASADVSRARSRAPDLVAAAERAQADAQEHQRHEQTAAASDDETRARLYIAAALAETERAEADEARLLLVHETDALDQESTELEAERLQIEQETGRLSASRAAGEELARALHQAETDEPRRRGLVSSGARGVVEVAAALVRRARLDLAVALSLAAPTQASEEAQSLLRQWEELPAQDTARLRMAEQIRLAAERALGQARANGDHATPEATASFVRMSTELGFTVNITSRGALIEIAENSAVHVARLGDVLLANPIGPALLRVAADTSGSARGRTTSRVVEELVRRGVAALRVQSGDVPANSRAAIVVLLPGYAPTVAP